MSNGMWGKMPSGRRVLRRRIPAECARTSFRALTFCEQFDGFCLEKASVACGRSFSGAGNENLACKTQQVRHVRKESGVAGTAFKKPGILVLYFALNATMAECCVLFSGGNQAALAGSWGITRGGHSEGLEELTFGPNRKRLTYAKLQRLTEQDESGIGVFRSSPNGATRCSRLPAPAGRWRCCTRPANRPARPRHRLPPPCRYCATSP